MIFNEEEKNKIIAESPDAEIYIKKFMGSQEVVRGFHRFCLWINKDNYDDASRIAPLKRRFESVREFRLNSPKEPTRRMAEWPYEFDQIRINPKRPSILIPRVTSERRPYLPVDWVGSDVISSDSNQVLYDAPEWCIALIASKLHLVWIATVCGKLKSDFRYSNTLGWNTFPVPKFTEAQLEALTASARKILKTRYLHHPKTIADLYDPDKMPDDLREAHRKNDELLETMYIGRPFRNDSERLEHLFKLYAAKMKSLGK